MLRFLNFRYLCAMQNAIRNLRSSLAGYDQREAQSIIDLLLEEVCHISRVERILHPDLIPDFDTFQSPYSNPN